MYPRKTRGLMSVQRVASLGAGLLLCVAGLAACGEDKPAEGDGDTPGVEVVEETSSPTTVEADPSTESYPAFERGERIERILALTPDPAVGAKAFETCAQCHGAQGYGSRDGQIPRLAGQLAEVLAQRLIEIGDGVRLRPEMEQYKPAIASDEQIAALASHIETLPDPADVRHGVGDHLAEGKKVYEDTCASCHAADGSGDRENGIPRISGWDASSVAYTLTRLQDEDAEVLEAGMGDLVSMLTSDEILWVADYVSWLPAGHP